MLKIFGEVISSAWGLMILMFVLGWVMQWVIRRTALICQSVYVIFVPWGILWTVMIAYLGGFLEYKQVVVLAALFLAAYPGIWWANYNFTQTLGEILRQKQVTRETTGTLIWADETRLVLRIKRWWRRLFGKRLNAEIVDWIMDQRGTNGYHVRHYYQPENIKRDN